MRSQPPQRGRWRILEVEQVVICTPDKDLTQMVQGERAVCLDRRKDAIIDEAAVEAKFGVSPESIPDYLALVGTPPMGYRGLPAGGRSRRPKRCTGTKELRICRWRSPTGT